MTRQLNLEVYGKINGMVTSVHRGEIAKMGLQLSEITRFA